MTEPPRLLASLCLLTVAAGLPGCIVEEINEGISQSNENVRRTNQDLVRINERIASIDEDLTVINERLTVLESIDGSLKRLDVHLASLRQTINNIDNTIPFLRLSGDSDEEEPAEAETPGGDGEAASTEDRGAPVERAAETPGADSAAPDPDQESPEPEQTPRPDRPDPS